MEMEFGDLIDARELEEIMSMAPAAAAAEYGLSDFLRDVSAVAGCNRILEAFAGGADQRRAVLECMRSDFRVSPQAGNFASRWMRAQDGGSGLESRLAEMWVSETSSFVDSAGFECSSAARIMFDQFLVELVDLDNFKRLARGSQVLMAQLATALALKLLAATEELRAGRAAEDAKELAETLRCIDVKRS